MHPADRPVLYIDDADQQQNKAEHNSLNQYSSHTSPLSQSTVNSHAVRKLPVTIIRILSTPVYRLSVSVSLRSGPFHQTV